MKKHILKTNYSLSGNKYEVFRIENGRVVNIAFSQTVPNGEKIKSLHSIVKSEYQLIQGIKDAAYLFLEFGSSSYYCLESEIALFVDSDC